MALYTYGGTPSDVLTDALGNVVPDYPLNVRVAGTGQLVTALFEVDGTTPIGELRSNPAGHSQPGAVRPFKCAQPEIEYEYLDAQSQPVRWYQAGREVAQDALAQAAGALSRSAGGQVQGLVELLQGAVVAGGLDVTGGATIDDLNVTGTLTVDGYEGGGSLEALRIFNPRDYGAAGDGVADDANAVQAALDQCVGAGGGQVLVPPGTYRLASLPLRVRRNTRLTLMPGAVFVRGTTGTLLVNGDADQNFGGYTGHGNLVIEGGVWDMRATDAPTDPDMAISIGHAENVVIRDLEIRDVGGYHAIELNSTRHGLIEGCRFLGYLDTGGRAFSEAVQFDLAGRVTLFGAFGPYDHTVCQDVVMRRCYVGASGTPGTVAWPAGVGSHSTTAGHPHKRIRVENNTFEGLAQYAVKSYCWDESVIARNIIQGCGAGIWLRTLDSSKTADRTNDAGVDTGASAWNTVQLVEGNIIRQAGSYADAILVQGESTGRWNAVQVRGNEIVTGGAHGIRMTYCTDPEVTGNIIRSVGGTGISTTQLAGGHISGNRVYDCGSSLLTVETGTDMVISDNHLSLCQSHGLWVFETSARLKVHGNRVKGAGRADGTGNGYRVTTNVTRLTLTLNTYEKWGSGTEAGTAIYLSSSVSGVRRFGNDVIGQAATPVNDTSASPNLSPYDAGT
ncbi:right-handed parallel beta-helix repeat-containing protein [Streptomyces sp. DSM 42041]|uniref:Right-handed parallel beta-helix repeat-containing protein n=1 Tax=Streptomyces hazeniae TaxID=3075538 RepID=A0ABU2NXU8_9ACTN|nr:right-handed parallel beta-helix repeat-containing protein [Streptomyces sp. DSM 42041]MDT0381441.1 right-handed parallel beta-helix repeat-containing protein [Streptomyces sp. DSM 42041]